MSTIKANTLLHSDGSTTTQPSIPALDQRMAKVWCTFDSTSTLSVIDSYNVSSITDIATGNFRANFATALPNNNYVIVGGGDASGTNNSIIRYDRAKGVRSTTSFGMRCSSVDGVNTDSPYNSLVVFGS